MSFRNSSVTSAQLASIAKGVTGESENDKLQPFHTAGEISATEPPVVQKSSQIPLSAKLLGGLSVSFQVCAARDAALDQQATSVSWLFIWYKLASFF